MAQKDNPISIAGVGHYLPENVVTNKDLISSYNLAIKEAFLSKQIGIKQRHFLSPDQSCSDIATRAAQNALAHANIQSSQLACLIVATSTADYLSPSTACVVQSKLGASGYPAFDVSAACSGFVYALEVASSLLSSSEGNYALVIGADVRSRTLDFTDKRTAFLYGDGAGAVVLQKSTPPAKGLIWSKLYADGAGYKAVHVGSVGANLNEQSKNQVLNMRNGQLVAEKALEGLNMLMDSMFESCSISIEDIDFFIFHQPNGSLLQKAIDQLNIPANKTLTTFSYTGNTVAASIPIALSLAIEKKLIHKGDRVVLCAIGAGYTGGIHLLEWDAE